MLEAEREAARWRMNERRTGERATRNFELLLQKRPTADTGKTSPSHVVVELSASGMLLFHLNSHELYIYISASIGIAIYPDDGIAHETLIKHANIVPRGRNDFRFFDSGLNQHLTGRMAVGSDLRRGLSHGEFEMHYQPKVDRA